MIKNFTIKLLSFLLLFALTESVSAQCKIENNYFQAGENLDYDLYFKWGLISKKSGTANMKVTNVKYAGQDAYRASLSSHSRGTARKFFELDDTISCIIDHNVVPLAFFKDAHEDGDYVKERISYLYNDNNSIRIRTMRHKNGSFRFDETYSVNRCTYDMMSVVFYARTLDYSTMKKGSRVSVDFMSGKKRLNMIIINSGTEKLKANDDNEYNCIKLSLKIADDAFEKEEDALTVYITNDSNRLPVRIDTKLKVGNARVILKSYRGNKYPVNKAK